MSCILHSYSICGHLLYSFRIIGKLVMLGTCIVSYLFIISWQCNFPCHLFVNELNKAAAGVAYLLHSQMATIVRKFAWLPLVLGMNQSGCALESGSSLAVTRVPTYSKHLPRVQMAACISK